MASVASGSDGRGRPVGGRLEEAARSLADPERSAALATRASAVVRLADAAIRFVLPYGQKEILDPANPSPTSGCRCAGTPARRGRTQLGRPGPTATRLRLRPAGAVVTGAAVVTVSRRLVDQETCHFSAPAVIVHLPSSAPTLPNGGLLPVSPPIPPRRTTSARPAPSPCRAPSLDAKVRQPQPPCGCISYPIHGACDRCWRGRVKPPLPTENVTEAILLSGPALRLQDIAP